MPYKIGAGKKPQLYSKATGRFVKNPSPLEKLLSGKKEKTQKTRMTMFSLLRMYVPRIETKTSLDMPFHADAVAPDEKFEQYALNPNHPKGKDKAKVFQSALGYNSSNYSGLKNQIQEAIITGKARLIQRLDKNDGIRYDYRIPVSGPNGKSAFVRVGYYLNNDYNRKPHLVTLMVEKKGANHE